MPLSLHARTNMQLVADGVRPAWLCMPGEAPRAALRSEAERMGLHVSDAEVAVDGEQLGVLVSRRRVRVPPRPTHAWVGRQLGLPCSSARDPWAAARRGHAAFAALGARAPGAPLQVAQRRRGGWRVRGMELAFTTFWCADAAMAHAWCGRFASRARAFELRRLRPLGLELCYLVVGAA